ncbi:hypothetical protein L3Y34_006280 [Caenorhabditis briggsae]|uniref:Peptidase S1 domain-containing protein n=1 Tax=Caenorhabditis briggsae TaxID=6238 RepID=A0AAE9A3L4_CAEBR|nr:hypothetical protein L3Y34_006280 [Caenorhabditis briggsae]
MKLLHLLPLVVFVVGVGAGKISEQENEQTQLICGKKADGYSRKVINGEYVKKGEHPWAVSVYTRYYDEKNESQFIYGPGTMISSRHIIKFNSLFYSTKNLNLSGREYTGYKGICEGDNLIVPQELLSRFDVDLEYLNDMNGNREFRNTIAKVTVINGCKQLLASNPMILELVAPLENSTVPVCISNSARNWERDDWSVDGSGQLSARLRLPSHVLRLRTSLLKDYVLSHYSVNGEEIKAETFAPLIISNSSTEGDIINGDGGEVIKAETFEPMEIDHRGSTRADRIRDIHIHIHLTKNTGRSNENHFSEAGGYSRKVINGEYVKKGEHPWAVSVYVRYYNKKNQFKTLLGPGTMISSRHIVAFNSLFRSTENLNLLGMEDTGIKGICEGDNLILPQELLPRYDADLEYLNDMNGNREFRNTIAKATVINGCKKLLPSNPMILELIAPLENSTVPVCISNSARNWERVGGFSVYGMDRPGRLVSGRFRPIECSASAPFSCAEASNKSSQGLCQGNFGGSAIAKMGHRHVMLGFYAGGNSACKANTETIPPFKFVNLGHYRQEICETTGVSAPEEEGTTTAEKVYWTHRGSTAEAEYFPHRVRFTDSHVPHQDLFTFKPPTVPSVAEEEINAETFAPLMISNSSLGDDVIKAETSTEGDVTNAEIFDPTRIGFDGEVIKAETFEPMEIDHRGSTRADRIRDIHIHIHLNK